MKKYLYLVFVLVLLITIQISFKSYAYIENCGNVIDNPDSLNSLDLKKYIKNKYYQGEVNYFCSYNRCYHLKNETLEQALINYLKLQELRGMEEYVIESKVKGFPITEISFNLCE